MPFTFISDDMPDCISAWSTPLLFGVRGSLRTLKPSRKQVNVILSQKREHSRKPEAVYDLIERCSPGPYLEMFARHVQEGWAQWGDELGKLPAEYPLLAFKEE
jgi:N6-adenosine-specific RNA methylase IME4